MKKILLGTSAIVGASVLLAAPVWAAEKPKLEISGFLRFEAWQMSQDINNNTNRGYMFETDDAEIHFKGSAKADNGLEYGFYVEMAEGSADSANGYDEANIFMAGNWGRLELGSQDAPHNSFKASALSVSADKDGAWDGNKVYNAAGNAADINIDFFGGDDANKISYYSPSFSGFTVGASFTPDTGASMNSGFPAENQANQSGQIGVAAQYKGTFSGVGVEVTGRYARAKYAANETDSTATEKEDARAYGFGAVVSYAGFSLGGSYKDLGDSGVTKANKAAGFDAGASWDVGVGYGTGPYKVSVVYYHSYAAQGNGVQDDEVDFLQVGANYSAAPGLDFYAAYQYVDLDQAGSANDNEANLFMVGTQVSF